MKIIFFFGSDKTNKKKRNKPDDLEDDFFHCPMNKFNKKEDIDTENILRREPIPEKYIVPLKIDKSESDKDRYDKMYYLYKRQLMFDDIYNEKKTVW